MYAFYLSALMTVTNRLAIRIDLIGACVCMCVCSVFRTIVGRWLREGRYRSFSDGYSGHSEGVQKGEMPDDLEVGKE